jgi:preprotein translocase subunit YajC
MHGQDLVEIPDHKLSKLNLTQADIFKGELSDSQVNEIARTKYIDPVRLVAFMKTEEKKQDKAKKSFSLIVKSDEVYTPGETLAKADLVVESKVENVVKSGMVIDIRKSRIEKIERILLARRNR